MYLPSIVEGAGPAILASSEHQEAQGNSPGRKKLGVYSEPEDARRTPAQGYELGARESGPMWLTCVCAACMRFLPHSRTQVNRASS